MSQRRQLLGLAIAIILQFALFFAVKMMGTPAEAIVYQLF